MIGRLCFSGFDSHGVEWSVRKINGLRNHVWVVYKGDTPYSRHSSSDSAYDAIQPKVGAPKAH